MLLSRRDFVKQTSYGLLSFGLMNTLLSRGLLAAQLTPKLDDWINELYMLGEKLDRGSIQGKAWQAGIDRLYARVDIPALLKHVDFDKVKKSMTLSEKGEEFITTPLKSDPKHPYVPGAPEGRGVITKIAGTFKGSAVPPHGHQNMVSAFLIVSGEYQVIQYDKLGSLGELRPGKGHLVVKEVQNERQRRGQWSSISDEKSNLHWLRGVSDDCFFFSTKLINLRDGVETLGRINIDVKDAKDLGDKKLKCPIITGERAAELFG